MKTPLITDKPFTKLLTLPSRTPIFFQAIGVRVRQEGGYEVG